MNRLFALLCGAAVVLLMPGVADASCAPIPGDRAVRLAQIAAGRGENDVAFIGRVVRRGDGVERRHSVWSPIVFHVVATFKGSPLRERTILMNGGCINGSCVSNGEALDYRGHRLQLVLADHLGGVGLVSVSDCSDAGALSADEVALMLRPSTLPMTGGQRVLGIAAFGAGALVVGGALLFSVRRMVAEPTTTSPSYRTTV